MIVVQSIVIAIIVPGTFTKQIKVIKDLSIFVMCVSPKLIGSFCTQLSVYYYVSNVCEHELQALMLNTQWWAS